MGEIDLSFMPQGTDILLLERMLKEPYKVQYEMDKKDAEENPFMQIPLTESDLSDPFYAMSHPEYKPGDTHRKTRKILRPYYPSYDEDAMLSKDSSLIERIKEYDNIILQNNIKHTKVVGALKKLVDKKNYMNRGYYFTYGENRKEIRLQIGKLYASKKPVKSYEYEYEESINTNTEIYKKLLNQCDATYSTKVTINRYQSDEEERCIHDLMNIEGILQTMTNWEDNLVIDPQSKKIVNLGEDKVRPGYEEEYSKWKIEEEENDKKLAEIKKIEGPYSFQFTELLPHLVEKYHFFPNNGRYNIDIPFFLKALGLTK